MALFVSVEGDILNTWPRIASFLWRMVSPIAGWSVQVRTSIFMMCSWQVIKGKGRVLAIALLTRELVTRSTLQSQKWQLIAVSE